MVFHQSSIIEESHSGYRTILNLSTACLWFSIFRSTLLPESRKANIKGWNFDDDWELSRLLFNLSMVLTFAFNPLSHVHDWGHVFFEPLLVLGIWPIPDLGKFFLYLRWLWLGLLLLNIFSIWFQKWARVILSSSAFFLGVLILGYLQSFGRINHHYNLVTLTLFIISYSDFSRWILLRLSKSTIHRSNPSSKVRWELVLVQLLSALFYFSAAWSKLAIMGSAWWDPLHLAKILLIEGEPNGRWLAQQSFLLPYLSFSVLVSQLLAPLSIFFSRGRLWWIFPSWMVLFHGSVYIFLAPNFGVHLICLVFWIPWSRFFGSTSSHETKNFRSTILELTGTRASLIISIGILLTWIPTLVFKKEHWPFSSFRMYIDEALSPRSELFSFEIEFQDGERTLMTDVHTSPLEWIVLRRSVFQLWSAQKDLSPAFLEIHRLIERNQRSKSNGKEVTNLRLLSQKWLFDLNNLGQPKFETKLVYDWKSKQKY